MTTPVRLHLLTETAAETLHAFYCPGCEQPHTVRTRGQYAWSWNESVTEPTLSPSVLVTTPGVAVARCHSYVEQGRIRFLTDCTHALAGQTVDLPEYPEQWR